MLSNATYNLMETASVISKGLHRYDTFAKDAQGAGCQGCAQMWNEMKQADQKQLDWLVAHLKEHLDKEERPSRAA